MLLDSNIFLELDQEEPVRFLHNELGSEKHSPLLYPLRFYKSLEASS